MSMMMLESGCKAWVLYREARYIEHLSEMQFARWHIHRSDMIGKNKAHIKKLYER